MTGSKQPRSQGLFPAKGKGPGNEVGFKEGYKVETFCEQWEIQRLKFETSSADQKKNT